MKPLSANAAAKMAGKAKGTILKALDDGTLSGTKNNKGQWEIDPSELARVFSFDPTDQSEDQTKKPPLTAQTDQENRLEIERLRTALQGAERLTETLSDEVADLRERLTQEGEERRNLTRMLTDQRERPAAPAPATVAARSLSLWERVTGRAKA